MSILGAYIVPHPPLIIPEVGKGEEKKIQKTIDAYENIAAEIGLLKPETIVIISPHTLSYTDYIHIVPGEEGWGDFSQYGAPKIPIHVKYDTDFVSELAEEAKKQGISAGTLGAQGNFVDHGATVPLYFINKYLADYEVCRISISGISNEEHYKLGMCLRDTIVKTGRKVVIVASGDLSHRLKDEGSYEFAEEGPKFDELVTEAMRKSDFLSLLEMDGAFCEAAGECGMRAFIIMAGALDAVKVTSEFLSYEGPFGVGYAVCKFKADLNVKSESVWEKYQNNTKEKIEKRREKEDAYVKLARLSLESFLRDRKTLKCPENLPPELTEQQAGVFVSLKKNGHLRGCIGTIAPVRASVAMEIIENAISSGVGDTRFEPVTVEELDQLVYSVDVLKEPESIDTMEKLDVQRYGVIVSNEKKRGLLLPNLEGVNTPEQQVAIALQKARISPDEEYQMERFEVVRHE